MPAARWWEFEEARVNFAEVQAEPEDLARMLIVEFSSVYGNDWYLWPLDLPVGAIHTVTRFEVTNTFGDLTSVESVPPRGTRAGRADWQLFRPTEKSRRRPRPHDGLLLLPTLASPRISEAVEEVRFLRDELANLAWAVEGTVTGEDGVALDRHAEAASAGELNPAPPAAGGSDVDPLRYRFSTHVPPFWFPLAPDPAQPTVFRRLVVRRVDADGVVRTSLPAGEVLAPPDLWLWREEVPREGSRVRRRFQMARGSDGLLYVWGSRLRSTGMGEGYSGLRYDDALPIEDETP
jgi:hypothetical protein